MFNKVDEFKKLLEKAKVLHESMTSEEQEQADVYMNNEMAKEEVN